MSENRILSRGYVKIDSETDDYSVQLGFPNFQTSPFWDGGNWGS
jgi:hypothetical protein